MIAAFQINYGYAANQPHGIIVAPGWLHLIKLEACVSNNKHNRVFLFSNDK